MELLCSYEFRFTITIIFVIVNFPVDECKRMYKSIRDAVRYRRKKIPGKSGDSGDENMIDDSNDDWELKEALSFLTPTFEEDIARDRASNPFEIDGNSSQSSVYSYVSICARDTFR